MKAILKAGGLSFERDWVKDGISAIVEFLFQKSVMFRRPTQLGYYRLKTPGHGDSS